mmetsp:Transcript_50246/g.162672  ORF Transcript_50246/g.162672 Transcript_50246/m.162672 type:complete len:88 (+) Transcript_50246:228-491(+)
MAYDRMEKDLWFSCGDGLTALTVNLVITLQGLCFSEAFLLRDAITVVAAISTWGKAVFTCQCCRENIGMRDLPCLAAPRDFQGLRMS